MRGYKRSLPNAMGSARIQQFVLLGFPRLANARLQPEMMKSELDDLPTLRSGLVIQMHWSSAKRSPRAEWGLFVSLDRWSSDAT